MKILSVSDEVLDQLYNPSISSRFANVDLVLGCGDMPYFYLEYIVTKLDVPAFFVRGNHAPVVELGAEGQQTSPQGVVDLHRRVVNHQGLLLAGVEGCVRYRPGPFQYSQAEMWGHVFCLAPRLLINRLIYGRYLDIFISHSPPWQIHDQPDRAHHGVKAFRWLLQVFKPAIHFHGHTHIYGWNLTAVETKFYATRVINTYGFRETIIDRLPSRQRAG